MAPQRYRIVNRAALAEDLSVERLSRLAVVHAEWIEAAVRLGGERRVPAWSESLAVGGREFVARVGTALGVTSWLRWPISHTSATTESRRRNPNAGAFGC